MKRIMSIMLILASALLFGGGCTPEKTATEAAMAFPVNDEFENGKLWTVDIHNNFYISVLENKKRYMLTAGNKIVIVNDDNGEIINEMTIKENIDALSGIDISNGILGIALPDYIIIYDTNTGEILYKHNPDKVYGTVEFSGMLIKDDIFITVNTMSKRIQAVNYKTGELVWEISGSANYSLQKYKDNFLYLPVEDVIYSFNPLTGATIEKYTYLYQGKIEEDNYMSNIPAFPDIEDSIFEKWMVNLISNYDKVDYGMYYHFSNREFKLFGADRKLEWTFEFPEEIETCKEYKKYIFIQFQNQIVLFDSEQRKFIWRYMARSTTGPYFWVEEDRLYIEDMSGEVTAYNLLMLKN